MTARGGDKASLTSLGATLGYEAHSTLFSFLQPESQRDGPNSMGTRLSEFKPCQLKAATVSKSVFSDFHRACPACPGWDHNWSATGEGNTEDLPP